VFDVTIFLSVFCCEKCSGFLYSENFSFLSLQICGFIRDRILFGINVPRPSHIFPELAARSARGQHTEFGVFYQSTDKFLFAVRCRFCKKFGSSKLSSCGTTVVKSNLTDLEKLSHSAILSIIFVSLIKEPTYSLMIIYVVYVVRLL
jgi:hypothetical protein